MLTLDQIELDSTATFLACMERMDGLHELHLKEYPYWVALLKDNVVARMVCVDIPTRSPSTDDSVLLPSDNEAVELESADDSASRPLLPSLTAVRIVLGGYGRTWIGTHGALENMLISRRQARVYGTWTVPALKDVEISVERAKP